MEELQAQVASLSAQLAQLQASLQQMISSHVHGQNAANIQIGSIFGLLQVVTTAPTLTPKGFYDQIKLLVSGSSLTLYVYDYVGHQWLTAGGGSSSYGGYMTATGGSYVLPAGWSSSVTSHVYKVVHNLGTTSYAVVAYPNDYSGSTAPSDINIIYSANYFEVLFADTSGSDITTDWNFILSLT